MPSAKECVFFVKLMITNSQKLKEKCVAQYSVLILVIRTKRK